MNILVNFLEKLPALKVFLSGVIDLLFLSFVGWIGNIVKLKLTDMNKKIKDWMESRTFIAQQKILTVQSVVV